MPKLAIVTGADSCYFPLLKDLVRSVRTASELDEADLCVLDLGLDGTQKDWIASQHLKLIAVKWDLKFEGRQNVPSHYKAMTARPFLPDYLPDYDIIMWLDSDIWVQNPEFVRLYYTAADRYGFAITPELDRTYPTLYGANNELRLRHHEAYYICFGRQVADELIQFPIVNSGAFAIRSNHPVWAAWRQTCHVAMNRAPIKHAEQAALNAVIFLTSGDQSPPHFLPPVANWICSLSLPMWNPAVKRLVEPNMPHQPLGLVYLAGVSDTVSIATTSGQTIKTGLTYGNYETLRGQEPG